jgi:hypothetical protein
MGHLAPAADDSVMAAELYVISDERTAISILEVCDGSVRDHADSELS